MLTSKMILVKFHFRKGSLNFFENLIDMKDKYRWVTVRIIVYY